MLFPSVFRQLCDLFFVPDVDLFATRIPAQVASLVSWMPDPGAFLTRTFPLWSEVLNYAFPLFSISDRVLQQFQEDGTALLVVLQLWPTQLWFLRALQLLVGEPVLLLRQCPFLLQGPAYLHHIHTSSGLQ